MLQNEETTLTDTFYSLFAHAEELIDAGRHQEARRLIAQFVLRKPVTPIMLPALAGLYLRLDLKVRSVETMEWAIRELGQSAELLNAFGLLLASIGREQESRRQFELALELDPDNPDVLRNLAFAHHCLGERREAYALLVRCYYVAPLSAELRLICGTLLHLEQRHSEAVACYRDVLELSNVSQQVSLATQRILELEPFAKTTLDFDQVIEALQQEFVVAPLSSPGPAL